MKFQNYKHEKNILILGSTTIKTDKLSKSRGAFKKTHDGGGSQGGGYAGGPTGGDGGNRFDQNNTATIKGKRNPSIHDLFLNNFQHISGPL